MNRRVLIIGGGFGGVNTANAVVEALGPRRKVEVTLISDRSHFLFTPLLPNAATGDVAFPSISVPLHDALRPNVELQIDRIEGVDLKARRAYGEFHHDYDLLVMAPGASTFWDGHPEWKQHALTCKHGVDAARIFDHVRAVFEQAAHENEPDARRRLLTLVVAGAGPTGISLLSELLALAHDLLRHRPGLAQDVRFVLVDPEPTILRELEPELGRICLRYLEKSGVELRLGDRVVHRDAQDVHLERGGSVPTASFFWCGGVRASSLIENTGLRTTVRGCASVNDKLQAIDQHGVYVIGDAADSGGDSIPWTAQVATQQAAVAAQNTVADLSGRSHKHWEYNYQGDIITLGRTNAAVTYKGVSFEGRAARALYQVVYTALVPSNMRKLLVFRDWWTDKKGRQDLLTAD